MEKYLAFCKIGYQVTIAYPAPIFFRILRHAAIVMMFVFLWAALLKDRAEIGGFNFRSAVTYYLLVEIIDVIYTQTPARLLSRDIRTGDLSNFLTKPLNYWGYLLSYTLGQQLAANSFSIPAVVTLFFLLPNYLAAPENPVILAAFLGLSTLSFLLCHQIMFVMGALAFWISEITHVRQGFNQLMRLLGGAWLPLNLFPSAVLPVLSFLPFSFLFNFPVRAFQQQVPADLISRGIFLEIIWLLVFLFVGSTLWSQGLKRYEAYGR